MSHSTRLFTFPPSESSGFSWSWRLNPEEDTFAHSPARTPVRFLFLSEGSSWYLRASVFPFIPSSGPCSDFLTPVHRCHRSCDPPPSGFPPAWWRLERSALAEEEERQEKTVTYLDKRVGSGRGVWQMPRALGPLGPLFPVPLRVFMGPQYHLRAKCLSPVTCLKSGVSPPQYHTQEHLEF